MDSHFEMLVLVTIFSIIYSVGISTAHPPRVINKIPNMEMDNVPPFYGSAPAEHEPYFNPSLYGLSAYGYGNMYMHRSGTPPFIPPPYLARPPPPYMGMHHHYPRPIPPPMAYWEPSPKKTDMSIPLSASFSTSPTIIPSEAPTVTPSTTPSTTPSKSPSVTSPASHPTSPSTTTSTTTSTTPPTTTTTTTTIATTIAATTAQPITEQVTESEEVVVTEAVKPQPLKSEVGEDPKQRQLSTNQNDNNCGPDVEHAEVSASVVNQQPSVTAAPTKPVLAIQKEASATEAAIVSSEEEATPAISYRRNKIQTTPELEMPPLYPEKALYNPGYPPMPYLPPMGMGMDPYRMNLPRLYPRSFYGY